MNNPWHVVFYFLLSTICGAAAFIAADQHRWWWAALFASGFVVGLRILYSLVVERA